MFKRHSIEPEYGIGRTRRNPSLAGAAAKKMAAARGGAAADIA
jgi:hypothetical protein